MKQLVCEMCGGTDLVKDGGVFICQTCGCKYSVEEAKKMMVEGTVEVTGTVKIDTSSERTKKIESYLQMCQNAFEGNDTDSVVEYSDKVLELDQDNYEAWRYRALTAGWNSSLNNMKTGQVLTAAKRAIQLAPPEEKEQVATDVYQQGKAQIVSHLKRALSMPGGLATITSKFSCIHQVMKAWVSLVVEIPYLSEELMNKEIADCENVDSGTQFSFSDVRACASTNNNKTKYSTDMRNGVKQKLEKEKQMRAERIREYWDNNKELKQTLETEKESLNQRIKELESQRDNLPEASSVKEYEKQIEGLEKEKNSLGLFKGKEKKVIQERIDEIAKKLNGAKAELEVAQKPINDTIKTTQERIQEIEKEFTQDR